MTSPNFADYPIPQEVKSAKYDPAPLQNPVLRGLPLSIAAALYEYPPTVAESSSLLVVQSRKSRGVAIISFQECAFRHH